MKFIIIVFGLLTQLVIGQQEFQHEVYFETDEFEVPPTEQNRLLMFLSKIETFDIERISIYGFTDDRGSDSYNLSLSQKRANSIKEIFSNNEFDESVITNVDGKGKILLKVVQEDNIQKIRGLNRKVEIIVQPFDPPRPEVVKEEQPSITEVLKGDIKAGDKLKLENILFKTGYAYLMPESVATLEEIAKFSMKGRMSISPFKVMCAARSLLVMLSIGERKRNLSEARAKYIYDYLAKKGVDKRRMKYMGMRRKFPLGGDPKFDRRVEILITYAETHD